MTSFKIRLQDNILHIDFGQQADNDQIVRDIYRSTQALIEKEGLHGCPLLGINGPTSIVGAYALAEQVADLVDTLAIYDPKMGVYVVVKSSTTSYNVGDQLKLPDESAQRPIKLVLCGPPHTGKSCIREGLKQRLLSRYQHQESPYPYVITACPDGEGAWYYGTVKNNPDLARQLKTAYKAKFTPEFAKQKALWVQRTTRPINIIDIGGKITDENTQILQEATHAIVLWRDPLETDKDDVHYREAWEDYCVKMNVKILSVFKSDYHATADWVEANSDPLLGTIHRLERGDDCSSRPVVDAIADLIVQALIATT